MSDYNGKTVKHFLHLTRNKHHGTRPHIQVRECKVSIQSGDGGQGVNADTPVGFYSVMVEGDYQVYRHFTRGWELEQSWSWGEMFLVDKETLLSEMGTLRIGSE